MSDYVNHVTYYGYVIYQIISVMLPIMAMLHTRSYQSCCLSWLCFIPDHISHVAYHGYVTYQIISVMLPIMAMLHTRSYQSFPIMAMSYTRSYQSCCLSWLCYIPDHISHVAYHGYVIYQIISVMLPIMAMLHTRSYQSCCLSWLCHIPDHISHFLLRLHCMLHHIGQVSYYDYVVCQIMSIMLPIMAMSYTRSYQSCCISWLCHIPDHISHFLLRLCYIPDHISHVAYYDYVVCQIISIMLPIMAMLHTSSYQSCYLLWLCYISDHIGHVTYYGNYAASRHETSAWLNCIPNNRVGTFIDYDILRIGVALRVGLSICFPHRCKCGTAVGAFGILFS